MEQNRQDQLRINVHDGDAFFAHQFSINFSPMHFFLDFKNVTPRMDERNKDKPTLVLKHNVVTLDVFHAKQIHTLLGKAISDYEKSFGEVVKPKQIEVAEKNAPKGDEAKIESPNYFG